MKTSIYGMIDDLYLLCAIIQHGSISGASQTLNIPTSTISRHINELEHQLNSRLLVKQGRKLVATEHGTQLYQQCQPLLGQLNDDVLNRMSDHNEVEGKIRIVIPYLFYQKNIKNVMMQFMKDHPKVELDMVLSQERVDPSTQADLMITFQQHIDDNMIARPIITTQQSLYMSQGLIDQFGIPQQLEDLFPLKWIGISKEPITFIKNQQHFSVAPSQLIKVNDIQTVIELVEEGIGIASIANNLISENSPLKTVLEDYQQPTRHGYLVYKERKFQPKAQRLLINLLIETCQP